MRIFDSIRQCVKEVERDLWEMGMRVKGKSFQDKKGEYETKEMVGYGLTLTDGKDWENCFRALGFEDEKECIEYVVNESLDRIKPPENLNPGKSCEYRPQVWNQFLEEDGKFSYTYPERIHSSNQITLLEDLLTRDSGSRQGIIQIYDSGNDHISRGGYRRVPCTMHYQVLLRGEFLYLIHNMRSCDLYTHFPIDLSISWLMANYFTGRFKARCPRVIMQIGSLHAFKKNLESRKIF